MTGGKELAAKLRGSDAGGIPWMVILDTDQKKLITSDGPDGNIGCPVQPAEVAHFMAMVEKTARNMTEADRTQVQKLLEANAERIRAARGR